MFWSIPSTDHSRVQLIDSSRWSSGSGLQTYITIKMNQGDINYWYEREKQGYCKDPASNKPRSKGWPPALRKRGTLRSFCGMFA